MEARVILLLRFRPGVMSAALFAAALLHGGLLENYNR